MPTTIPPTTAPPIPPTTVPPLVTVTKWLQSPDMGDPGMAIKVDQFGSPHILADDFPCDTTGRLVEITIWGAFLGDIFGSVDFELAIHSDIPVVPSTTAPGTTIPPVFSKPDTDSPPLWTMSFPSGSYTIVPVATLTDWWWDPDAPPSPGNPSLATGTATDWKLTFTIDPNDAFLQTGTPSEPMIYWLSVAATTSGAVEFGWKTRLVSEDTFGDNAVWAPSAVPPPSSAWGEMTYPIGHPLAGETLDTAFALETLEVATTVPPTTAPPPPAIPPLVVPPGAQLTPMAAVKDNTLYEHVSGLLSNGVGDHFFSGRVNTGGGGGFRRGVVDFDVAGIIPAGSTIVDAQVVLHMSRTTSGPQTITMRRLLKDWGEGTSDGPGEEGQGAASTIGDATWIHTFFNTIFWTSPGGDFSGVISAGEIVNAIGDYAWQDAQLVVDIQDMLDNPSADHGWIFIGNEAILGSTKRFDTRENPVVDNRPELQIVYTPAPTTLPPTTVPPTTAPPVPTTVPPVVTTAPPPGTTVPATTPPPAVPSPEKGYAVVIGAQHALNKPETQPLDHDTGLGFAEKHFNPLHITGLQLWAGELGGPFTWQTASDAGPTPPTTLTMSIGETVQFRVTVFDRNGCGRWLDVGVLRVEANPDIGFVLSGDSPASLIDKDGGTFEAVSAGELNIVARVVQGGVDIDSQTISVTVA